MLHLFAQTVTNTMTTSQTSSAGVGSLLAIIVPTLLIVAVLMAAQWKIFKKAGKPGWAALIPVYNTYVLFEITGYPAWIALLQLVPIANLIAVVYAIMATFKLARLFGKSDGFALCMIFFPYVTYPILGFGSATFSAPSMPSAPMDAPVGTPTPAITPEQQAPVASFAPNPAPTEEQQLPTAPAEASNESAPQFTVAPQPEITPPTPEQPSEQQPPLTPPANPVV